VSLLALTRAHMSAAGAHMSAAGAAYAIASGSIASGLGYVVWFAAVRQLRATTAATVQLSVPIIAAFGGVLLLGEAVTPRLAVASAATLGGIWLVLAQRTKAV
jgi:drug/metabolite transporter (DMT)-like permease